MRNIVFAVNVVLLSTINAVFLFSTTSLAQQASLDLQEKCAKQEQSAFDKMYFKDRALYSFTNRYNVKLNRCIIETEQDMVPGGPDTWWNYKSVTDTYEGKDFGSYAWHSDKIKKYWEVPPFECEVNLPTGEKRLCKSSAEFDDPIKAYMQ